MWQIKSLYKYLYYQSSLYLGLTLWAIFGITPPTWFDVNIDNPPAYQVLLVYPPEAKFDKTCTETSFHIVKKLTRLEVQLKIS